jgi:outer membrane protein OmpA-like peptidoglycan-associated protein
MTFALAWLVAAAPAQATSPYYVFFDPGSAHLTQQALTILDYAAAGIAEMQAVEIEIAGATDRVGSRRANVALSRRRAEAVHAALVARGLSPNVSVRIAAAGEIKPLVETADGVAEAQNRYAYVLLRSFASTSPLVQEAREQLNQRKSNSRTAFTIAG